MKKLSAALCALFLTGLAAHADGSKEKRFSLQLGVARPLTSAGKNLLSTSPAHSILSYDLGGYKSGVWGLYAQGAMKNRDFTETDGDEVTNTDSSAGFGLQYRQHSASNPALYFGAGIGSYGLSSSVSIRSTSGSTTTTTTTTTTSNSVLGGRLFVGQTFGSRFLAELSYTATGSPKLGMNKINASNLSLAVGVRF